MGQKFLSIRLWTSAVFWCIISIAAANPEIIWVDCQDHVPPVDVFDPTGVDFENLPSTLKCGQIVVPMDYSHPLDTCNNITLGLAMHRPDNPKGVIFLLAPYFPYLLFYGLIIVKLPRWFG